MKKNIKSSQEELIHVKLEYHELIQAKKEILNLELSLLKIVRTIKKYHELRMQEFDKKEFLYKNIKQTSTKLKSLQKTLPKLKQPSMLKHPHQRRIAALKDVNRVPSDQGIDAQLQEIQNRLNLLQG